VYMARTLPSGMIRFLIVSSEVLDAGRSAGPAGRRSGG